MSRALLLRDGLPDLLPPMMRAPGVHVSTVIKYIAVQRGLLKADNSALSRTWASLGQAHEHAIREMYARRWPDRFIANPPELCVDRVYMNLDMLDYAPLADADESEDPDAARALIGDQSPIVVEVKLAEMGSRHTPRACEACGEERCARYWRYESQGMSYAHAVGCTCVRYDITHRQGDWKGGGPVNRPWLVGYEASEVEANWRMIVAHADEMRCEACGGSGVEDTSSVSASTCAACAGKGVKPWALMEG